jgi:hypothetical protein
LADAVVDRYGLEPDLDILDAANEPPKVGSLADPAYCAPTPIPAPTTTPEPAIAAIAVTKYKLAAPNITPHGHTHMLSPAAKLEKERRLAVC